MRIALIDVDCGNTGSVAIAFERLGVEVERTADAERIAAAERVVLPGVGAAGFVMTQLDTHGLVPVLRAYRRPLLGICLGMQLLFERSEEANIAGLGIIPGAVRGMAGSRAHPVPHMGWSRLSVRAPGAALGLIDGDYAYFAHSFVCDDGPHVAAAADHGRPVPAVVADRNFHGVQFHPERSAAVGAKVLEAFLRC